MRIIWGFLQDTYVFSKRYFVFVVSTGSLIEIAISCWNKATATMLDLISVHLFERLRKSSENKTIDLGWRKGKRMYGRLFTSKSISSKYMCTGTDCSQFEQARNWLFILFDMQDNQLLASQPAIATATRKRARKD